MMTYLLQGVIREGTAAAAAVLNWPLAGKTGTTDEYTDAWFIGFSPSLCAGVWVGYDTKITLGARQSGAVAALPIWKDFFGKVIEAKKKEAEAAGVELVPEDFEVPPNLSFVDIDRKTGLLATPICRFPLREVFFPGTEPSRFCTNQDHLRILDYYSQETATRRALRCGPPPPGEEGRGGPRVIKQRRLMLFDGRFPRCEPREGDEPLDDDEPRDEEPRDADPDRVEDFEPEVTFVPDDEEDDDPSPGRITLSGELPEDPADGGAAPRIVAAAGIPAAADLDGRGVAGDAPGGNHPTGVGADP